MSRWYNVCSALRENAQVFQGFGYSLYVWRVLLGVKRSHLCSHAAVTVPCFWLCDLRRSMSTTRLFAATSVRSHTSSSFGLWSVERETRKVSRCHRYQAIAEFSCRIRSSGAGKICAVYQALARRKTCTYLILCDRHRSLQCAPRAWVRIVAVICDQVLCADCFTVFAM